MIPNHGPYKLIVVEGIDGVGKTTLVHDLVATLNRTSQAVRFDEISLLNPTDPLKRGCEQGDQEISFFTYLLSTLHKDRVTREQLQHSHVVVDRYVYSVLAHHASRGVDIHALNLDRFDILQPDYTILLTAQEPERRRRIVTRGVKDTKDQRLNQHGSELEAIEKTFKQLIEHQIDTTHLSSQEVLEQVLDYIGSIRVEVSHGSFR